MRSFKQHINEQAKTKIPAAKFEELIVIAFNGGFNNAKDRYGIEENLYNEYADVVEKIANDIRDKTGASENSMIHFGSGAGKLNPNWRGTNNTPKTDLYSTDGINISLKKKGGSQLMSGYKDETLATFDAAVEYMGKEAPEDAARLVKQLEPVMKKLTVQGNINSLVNAIKKNVIPKTVRAKFGKKNVDIDIDQAKYQESMKSLIDMKKALKGVQPIVRDYFQKNPIFSQFFCYEAATGETKFLPDTYAKANWLVEFDDKGGSNLVEKLSEGRASPSSYIKGIAKKVDIRVSVKTPTGSRVSSKGTADTVGAFRLIVNSHTHKLENEILNEQTLNENLFVKIKNWLKDLFLKIMRRLKELAKYGIDAILRFFEIEPEKVETSGLQMFGYK